MTRSSNPAHTDSGLPANIAISLASRLTFGIIWGVGTVNPGKASPLKGAAMTPHETIVAPCICGKLGCAISYGLCHCGCGLTTPIAKKNDANHGVIRGKPFRFAPKHNGTHQLRRTKGIACICGNPHCIIPFGLCHCGCNQKTAISANTSTARKRINGWPYKYIHGHAGASFGAHYTIVDMGYKTPCWIWKRHKTDQGYGMVRDPNLHIVRSAHIVYYERKYGEVKVGLQLDHLCRQRACVNPDHLEQVPFRVNVARGVSCSISREMIHQVKALLSTGMRQTLIAAQVGVSQAAVSDIKLGKKDWRLHSPQLDGFAALGTRKVLTNREVEFA